MYVFIFHVFEESSNSIAIKNLDLTPPLSFSIRAQGIAGKPPELGPQRALHREVRGVLTRVLHQLPRSDSQLLLIVGLDKAPDSRRHRKSEELDRVVSELLTGRASVAGRCVGPWQQHQLPWW